MVEMKASMNLETAAGKLAELGHPTRLDIYRQLVRRGRGGTPVGEIQTALDVPASTLSHHISRLVTVGLVAQRREGRTLYCIPQFDELDALLGFLREECCRSECCAA